MANEKLKYILNKTSRKYSSKKAVVDFVDMKSAREARAFHKNFNEYQSTPLVNLKELAKMLDVANIYVKDESYRFGLNAFKVLGGAFAIGNYLSKELGVDVNSLSFDDIKKKLVDTTFVTATDGNHGKGIAWSARILGQKSVVFMPKGSSQYRLDSILEEGAIAEITSMNYDDCVRLAKEYADSNGGVLIQDTAWEGYEVIPKWIMQGYTTIIDEVFEQLDENELQYPTHIFLQAGVGSFAASILGYVVSRMGECRPMTIIVEPDEASCIFKSVEANDGNPHAVKGDMPTIMAGLACGEPSLSAWNILRDYADAYVSCHDTITALGMRVLGNPLDGDKSVIAGESGAVAIGLLNELCLNADYKLACELAINKSSRILVINTEGDTDPINYRDIVWRGKYSAIEYKGEVLNERSI